MAFGGAEMSVEIESTHRGSEADGTAKRVADAFLSQYYEILGRHPELLHKFYADSSVISRPGSDGSMSSATTLDGIDGLIQSLYSEGESDVELCTADAQFSYGDGLVILVTGLIGNEEVKKRFSQMFFLAPQERGYYVLNDVFQYSGEEVIAAVADAKVTVAVAVQEIESTDLKQKAEDGKKDSESTVVDKEVIIEPKTSPGVKGTAVTSTVSNGQPNGKLSYASIIKAPSSATTAPQSAPAAPRPSLTVTAPSAPISSIVKEPPNINAGNSKRSSQGEDKNIWAPAKVYDSKVEERSISVWELPLSIKPYQLDRSFSKKFGPVKQGGIQIRNAQGKNGPICYAFIEFESASSAEAAIKASPVSIDGRPVTVKRKTNKAKNDGKQRNGSPQSENNNSNNGRANGKPSNGRNNGRHGDSSQDINNPPNWIEYGTICKNTGQATPAKPEITKPEIDEEGFRTVSRNGKWKTQGN